MKKLTMSFLSALLIVFTFLPVVSTQAAETKAVQTSEIPFDVLKADIDEVSTAGDFVKTPAKVVVENGKTFVYATLLQSEFWQSLKVQSTQPGTFKEDNFVAAEVISSDKKENTRVVKFEIKDVTKVLNVKAHIIVTGVPGIGKYDHTYDLRLKFDGSKLPETPEVPETPETPEVLKNGLYTMDYKVLNAEEDKESSMSRYIATPAELNVVDGKNLVSLTLTNNEQITVFQVEKDGEFLDAKVVSTDETANKRVIEFEVADLTTIANAKVEVFVAAANHKGNYDIRLAFDKDSVKVKSGVEEEVSKFTDIETSWAKEYIESLVSKKIVKGTTETTFSPNNQISRAQFAILLSRALDLELTTFEGTYSDVTKKMDWAVLEVEAAGLAGIIKVSDAKFRPYEKITRQQMVTMIIRAIEYKDSTVLTGLTNKAQFADEKKIDVYAKDAVNQATELEIISGKEVNGKQIFDPRANATRAHAAKMVYNLLEKLN